ncbi:hypothetical protein RIF29_00761 [Crotalaria pallida]|uniref:Uncharacterized protein n=1 Tax=Crotalaria pallida TaxID=3830 RepID=A0AAN9P7E4_CROPI
MGGDLDNGKTVEAEEALVDLITPSSKGKSNAGDLAGKDKGPDQRPVVDGKHGSGTMVDIEATTENTSKNSMNSGGSNSKAVNENDQGA